MSANSGNSPPTPHELRTPLTITQTLLDVARNDPNRDTGELVDRLHVIPSAVRPRESRLVQRRAWSAQCQESLRMVMEVSAKR